jgi:hypothetical protein
MVDEDAGGRPRAWLDDKRVLIETFGSGLNSFITLDVADAARVTYAPPVQPATVAGWPVPRIRCGDTGRIAFAVRHANG